MKPSTIKRKLKLLGFEVVTRGKSLFAFDFEKYHVLYLPDPKNPDCLRFALPCIYEVDDDNRQAVLGVVNRINAIINYVKLFEVNDQIWVLYEHCLVGVDDEDKLDGLIAHCLRALDVAARSFYDVIDGAEDDGKEDDEDE